MGDAAEDQTVFNLRNRKPFIHGGLYPGGYRHRAHMTALPEQINDGPVVVSLLKVRQLQTDQLGTPQAAAEQEGQDGMVPFALRETPIGGFKQPAPLSAGEPVTDLPTRVPSFLAPFTRLMLAARSGLSRPLSEAS
jgi:hypothetical protein